MRQIRYTIKSPPKSLLGRIVGFFIGLIVLAISIVVGGLFLAAILGVVLITVAIVAIRMWWLRRQLGAQAQGEFIETEYKVVDRREHD